MPQHVDYYLQLGKPWTAMFRSCQLRDAVQTGRDACLRAVGSKCGPASVQSHLDCPCLILQQAAVVCPCLDTGLADVTPVARIRPVTQHTKCMSDLTCVFVYTLCIIWAGGQPHGANCGFCLCHVALLLTRRPHQYLWCRRPSATYKMCCGCCYRILQRSMSVASSTSRFPQV